MKIETIPFLQVKDSATRTALDVLMRNMHTLVGPNGFASKDELAELRRLINSQPQPETTRSSSNQTTNTSTTNVTNVTPLDPLPVVSGAYNEIFTLSQTPPNLTGTPTSLQVVNESPGMTSPVDPVTGSGGDWHNFAQINIVGSFVYPAADMNQGFGGFLNFITRNLAGTPIQGAFVNGGLIGTTAGAERGDLDFGIYGHPGGGGFGVNRPRIIALRAEVSGTLALTVDYDGEWDLGDQIGRWRRGFFKEEVQCGGIDMNFNSGAPWVARLANPSSQIDPGGPSAHASHAGWMRFYWNAVPVYVQCFT